MTMQGIQTMVQHLMDMAGVTMGVADTVYCYIEFVF